MNKDILRVCFKPLTFINKLIRKDEKLIFFYSNLGFRDNVRAFYEYLIENNYNDEFKIVVSLNDYEFYEKDAPQNVTFISNKKGIKTFMKAKYAFYCFGKYPIKPSDSQTVVNLWHGTPLKKIGNLEKGLEKIDYNYFSKVITSAPMYKPIMAKIFGCTENNVEVLGNPRNDELFKEDRLQDDYIKGNAENLVIWLPTYREYDENFAKTIIDKEKLNLLNEFLKTKKCKMIIKLHPLQEADVKEQEYSNIEFALQENLNKKNITVYTLLRNADALITDYSSVYFDYLLLDKPIAFTIDDIERYKKERGFVFENPQEYMPGPHIENLEEIKEFISNVAEGIDKYKERRHFVNDKVNYYKDGNSCKRIAERFIS